MYIWGGFQNNTFKRYTSIIDILIALHSAHMILTVGEINIGAPKSKTIFEAMKLMNCLGFHYCDSNVSFYLLLLVVLSLFAIFFGVRSSFLLLICSYGSYNYCYCNSYRSFSLLEVREINIPFFSPVSLRAITIQK